MREDPSYTDYRNTLGLSYKSLNYDKGPAAWFMRKSHHTLEREFTPDQHFGRVLEVGAGTAEHVKYIRHSFDEYFLTDSDETMMNLSEDLQRDDLSKRIILKQEDATSLSFPNDSFDRLIAAHVLEHIPNPHKVLREWHRVLKFRGILSIILPCDPGLFWRIGRHFGPRRNAQRAGIEYDYWMAREHINSINNLYTLLKYYFPPFNEIWYPTRIPSTDLNLFHICNIRVD